MLTRMDDLTDARRTAEGWVVVEMTYRNDDPWVLDDNWHRGPYWVYRVPGTLICEEGDAHNLQWADAYDRVMARLAACGEETVETVRTNTKAEPYRVIKGLESYRRGVELPAGGEEDDAHYDGADRGL